LVQCQYLNPENGHRCKKQATGEYTVSLDSECGYDNFWCCTALCNRHGKLTGTKGPNVNAKGQIEEKEEAEN